MSAGIKALINLDIGQTQSTKPRKLRLPGGKSREYGGTSVPILQMGHWGKGRLRPRKVFRGARN